MTDTPATQHAATDGDDARAHATGADVEALRAMTEAARGTLIERMGIELADVTPERVTATMPVDGNTQPYGLLHGGASVVLAETLGSIAAMLHAGEGRIAVGVDINATHHRGVRSGVVHGVATPAHRGRTSATYDVVVLDEKDRRVCTARITCAILDRPGR